MTAGSPTSTITIGGRAGTGTSTLSRLVSARTGLPYVYAGQLFRDEAARRGLTLAEFGALAEEDPAVDRSLDDRQVEVLRAGDVVLEGRLAGWLARRAGLPAYCVWVTCEDDERLRRIAGRDGGDPAEQAARTRTREASEQRRYGAYYGIELDDLSPYDLVLDSTHRSPGALADEVLAHVSAPPA